jgi:hypothetical protein
MFNSVFKGVVASPNRGGVVFSTQYQAVLTYATSQGWTLPTAGQQVVQNNLMVSLVSAGIFAKLDALYITATNGSPQFSIINWISPGSNSLVATGSPPPSFSSNEGWVANASPGQAFMNTGFVFTNAAPQKLRTADATAFVWVSTAVLGATILGNSGNPTTLRILNTNNNNQRIMTNTNTAVQIDFRGTGLKASYSIASNSQRYYNDTTLRSTQAITSAAPNTTNPVTLYRSLITYGSNGLVAPIFGFGANIEANHSTLYTALNTYMTNK